MKRFAILNDAGEVVNVVSGFCTIEPNREITDAPHVGIGWAWRDGAWIAPAEAAPAAAAPAYYRLSQDTLIQRLAGLGKWEAFKAALQAASPIAWDRFVCAPYIASTDAMFVERAPEMKLVLGLSDAEFAALVAPEE